MKPFLRLHRHIDPGDTLGELIFGMIMVMTFTLGARLLGADEPTDGRELMIAALGCNIAWGIIDGFLYLLGAAYERRARAANGAAEPIGLRAGDFRAAVLICVLVVMTAVPAALPFLFLEDSYVALRVSNALMTLLLFVVGYLWGKHVGAKPVQSGLLIMSIGVALVLVAIPLGG
jgi:VIT1/CCC1 family predicted Fe2+/Mn2+ transporter